MVQTLPNSGRDFTQMLAQTPGFAGLSTGGGAGVASVNGTRSNSVNWQIEGTDNNDLWWNIPAVNQGGVSSIAGVILPVDAIENFSFVTAGSTELGHNSGGTANLTIKSGTNSLHGTAYYFNHNEFFQHSNPFTGTTDRNPQSALWILGWRPDLEGQDLLLPRRRTSGISDRRGKQGHRALGRLSAVGSGIPQRLRQFRRIRFP